MKQQNDINVTHSPLPESVEEPKWQLCPKCNGTGQMYINEAMTNPMNTSCRIGYYTCDVCGGAKILASPSDHSAEVERLRKENLKLRDRVLELENTLTDLVLEIAKRA